MEDNKMTMSMLRKKVAFGEYKWIVTRGLGYYIQIKISNDGIEYTCAIPLTDSQYYYFMRLKQDKVASYISNHRNNLICFKPNWIKL